MKTNSMKEDWKEELNYSVYRFNTHILPREKLVLESFIERIAKESENIGIEKALNKIVLSKPMIQTEDQAWLRNMYISSIEKLIKK